MTSLALAVRDVRIRLLRRPLDFLALTKPRVVLMVLATALVGFYLASASTPDLGQLGRMLIGLALAAAGTLALNQYLERDVDARMARTERRPLPDGRVRPAAALAFGLALVAAGLSLLASTVHPLTALVVLLTAAVYLGLYTPLKRRTPLCALLGAVPGALPPVAGWTAVQGELASGAWILFGILFVWQLPHTQAIASVYRSEYACAGLRLAPVEDPDGRRASRQVVAGCAALLAMGLLPWLVGMAGPLYLAGAVLLGLGFLGCGLAWAARGSPRGARRLIVASLLYLPTLLFLLAMDRLPHG